MFSQGSDIKNRRWVILIYWLTEFVTNAVVLAGGEKVVFTANYFKQIDVVLFEDLPVEKYVSFLCFFFLRLWVNTLALFRSCCGYLYGYSRGISSKALPDWVGNYLIPSRVTAPHSIHISCSVQAFEVKQGEETTVTEWSAYMHRRIKGKRRNKVNQVYHLARKVTLPSTAKTQGYKTYKMRVSYRQTLISRGGLPYHIQFSQVHNWQYKA